MPKKPARTAPAPVVPDLPADEDALSPAAGPPRAQGSYDGELFGPDVDLSGVDARDSRFLGCVLRPRRADGFVLAGARVVDCRLEGIGATEARWRAGTWRDTVLADSRVGALDLSAVSWDRVALTGGRYDFVDLREAELVDVTFTGADLRDVDLTGARLTRVAFVDCRLGHLDVSAATLSAVDLTSSDLEGLSGVGNLRGARVSGVQLARLAPLFAHHLGVEVAD
ncbi:pentapeptide repeat-containing protein [Kineococcus rhizosphaerae]|uniref:pentapeptide repeat-containing protein n=1 Tax=Kineococcus rhizosphaerae TaxID=559628 RepID=UPI0014731594|nr:pentapeptide repeat-containing protein [Kineococcus rhizosphaerae]